MTHPLRAGAGRSGVLWTVASVLLCGALMGWLQFAFDGLHDSDSYFHARAASELDRHGIRREFPQTAFSTWRARYSDKDFLFHAALIPVQRILGVDSEGVPASPELVRSGKWAVVVFDLLLFAAVAWALGILSVRFAAVWVLVLFCSQPTFLAHVAALRPHVLGYALVALEIALIARGRARALFVVGALHTWTHSSFFLVPLLGAAALAGYRAAGERLPRRVLVASVLGPLATFLLHPYFPNNLHIAWEQLFEVARSAWGVDAQIPLDLFGRELMAGSTLTLLVTFPAWAPAVVALLAFVTRPAGRRLDGRGAALVLMTGLILVLSMLSQRFLGFLFPAAVLLGAHLWTVLLDGRSLGELWRTQRAKTALSAGLFLVCLGVGQQRGHVGAVRDAIDGSPAPYRQRRAIAFLTENAAPDELVYHNFWFSFSVLYHFRPEGRYVVALDPVFFQRHDPELFRKALRAYRGRSDDLHGLLAGEFGARWVYTPMRADHQPFLALLHQDPRFELAYEDNQARIHRIRR